ncbi:MAG: YegP family protein [Pseudarthrobacter sp.]|nr:YegP family protein [Pseudarthrobacter sp.]NUS35145.1 YegP family protein [Pseudarthrobacter sp.]
MAGYFELVDAPDGGYRVRMLDGAGNLMAISVTFPTKRAAVAGVAMAREIAGTGLIRDKSHDGAGSVIRDRVRPVSVPKEEAARRKKLTPVHRAVVG